MENKYVDNIKEPILKKSPINNTVFRIVFSIMGLFFILFGIMFLLIFGLNLSIIFLLVGIVFIIFALKNWKDCFDFKKFTDESLKINDKKIGIVVDKYENENIVINGKNPYNVHFIFEDNNIYYNYYIETTIYGEWRIPESVWIYLNKENKLYDGFVVAIEDMEYEKTYYY